MFDVVRILGARLADPAIGPLVEIDIPRFVELAVEDFDRVGVRRGFAASPAKRPPREQAAYRHDATSVATNPPRVTIDRRSRSLFITKSTVQ